MCDGALTRQKQHLAWFQSQVLISWLLDKDAKPRVYAVYLQTPYVNRVDTSHLCTETLNPDRGAIIVGRTFKKGWCLHNLEDNKN
jgi:hypothetical protein